MASLVCPRRPLSGLTAATSEREALQRERSGVSVLDASAYTDALTSTTALGEAARARLEASARWHAPAILPAEVLAAVRGLVAGGHLDDLRAQSARTRLRRGHVELHAFRPFEHRIWQLRTSLTVYDAWYVALAERLRTSLVTTDARIARATGPRCEIDLVSANGS